MKKLIPIIIMLMMSGCWFTKDRAKTLVDLIPDKPVATEKTSDVEPVTVPVKEVDTDIALIKSFQWVDTGDGCESGVLEHGSIVKTYTGFVTNPFSILAEVPQDFTLAIGPAGCHITIPKSDPTGNMSKMGDRRAFICLFNADKVLVGTEDFNGDRLDNRWRNRDVAYGVVFHCIHNRVVSRSQVFKAGEFMEIN